MKYFLLIVNQSPFKDYNGESCTEFAMAIKAYNQPLNILIYDIALYQLAINKQPENILRKDFTKFYNACKHFEIDNIYVIKEQLEKLNLEQVSAPVEILPIKQVNSIISSHDIVINY